MQIFETQYLTFKVFFFFPSVTSPVNIDGPCISRVHTGRCVSVCSSFHVAASEGRVSEGSKQSGWGAYPGGLKDNLGAQSGGSICK